MAELEVVTGAVSFTGRFVAEELLARGRRVRTLTRREADPSHPLAGRVERAPLLFDESLRESLADADTLYNTYWVRLERAPKNVDRAAANTRTATRAATDASVP